MAVTADAGREGSSATQRVRIFVDFWNLQITMNEREHMVAGAENFQFDWSELPRWLVKKAAEKCELPGLAYEGMHVYASYDPLASDEKLKRWLLTWLNRRLAFRWCSRSAVRRMPLTARSASHQYRYAPSVEAR